VDGAQVAQVAGSGLISTSTSPVTIGSSDPAGVNPKNYFNGIIDDVRIYNRALSATEVTALYNYTGAGGSGCSSPAGVEGNMFYNSDLSVMEYCNNESWVRIGQ
jgi:hypothetical protein